MGCEQKRQVQNLCHSLKWHVLYPFPLPTVWNAELIAGGETAILDHETQAKQSHEMEAWVPDNW